MSIQTQQEHLLSKYVGTGNADTSKHELAVQQLRDTHAYVATADDLQSYVSCALDCHPARVRDYSLSRMAQPTGAPPPPPQDRNFLLQDILPKKKRPVEEELV